jgi:hypothetical protein
MTAETDRMLADHEPLIQAGDVFRMKADGCWRLRDGEEQRVLAFDRLPALAFIDPQ